MLTVASYSSLKKAVIPKGLSLVLALTGLGGILLFYYSLGQPGFFGDHLFVVLKSQADFSEMQGDVDYQAKRKLVYTKLVKMAEDTQTPLLDQLDKMKIKHTSYYLLNAVEVEGGKLLKWRLEHHPSVERILESPQLRPLPQKAVLQPEQLTTTIPTGATWNLTIIGADRVKEDLKITGSGIVIGQTDSGVDGKHPELINSYRGLTSGDDYNWFDPWNRSVFPVDPAGHGTLTLGVVMGENIGVAPDAEWIGCANLARNLGNPAYYLDCMQFMLAPFPQDGDPFKDGDPARGAMVINNSWGCPEVEGCDAQVFSSVVETLTEAGIFMSVSAGNNGFFGCGTVSDPPAIYADTFTVGSINNTGNLSDFSSLGPVTVDGSNRRKPDLLAPGDDIFSSYPGGGYSYVSGTSFAAPHVSGVVALMWSANPELIGDVEKTSQILRDSTKPYNGSAPTCGEIHDAVGFGILDAYQAVTTVLSETKTMPVSNE
jgi:subtilisin family serine protease